MAQKENMFYFETSAKSGEGVNNMMYTCISFLPFFEQYKNNNSESLIQDLMKINGENAGKVYDVNNNARNLEKNGDISSHDILGKDNKDRERKKCGCWS